MFLISGSTGDVAQQKLLNVDTFWWKFEVVTEENLVLDSSTTVDFDVSATLFDSKLTLVSWTGLSTLLSTLCTTGEGHLTLWTRFGEISFCDNLSPGETFSFFRSRGSLKVVRLRVFGGVGRGCRGNDDANVVVVVVVKAAVGDEPPARTYDNKKIELDLNFDRNRNPSITHVSRAAKWELNLARCSPSSGCYYCYCSNCCCYLKKEERINRNTYRFVRDSNCFLVKIILYRLESCSS